jgi:hypothetical protein
MGQDQQRFVSIVETAARYRFLEPATELFVVWDDSLMPSTLIKDALYTR